MALYFFKVFPLYFIDDNLVNSKTMKIENIELSNGDWKFTVKTDRKIVKGDKIKFNENLFPIDMVIESFTNGAKNEEIGLYLSNGKQAHRLLKLGDEIEIIENRIIEIQDIYRNDGSDFWFYMVKTNHKIGLCDRIKFNDNFFVVNMAFETMKNGIVQDGLMTLNISPNEEAHSILKVGDKGELVRRLEFMRTECRNINVKDDSSMEMFSDENKDEEDNLSYGTILKRDNKFVVEFPDELCLKPWVVETVERPSIELDTEEVCDNPSDKKHFVVTGYHWNPVTFTLIDPIGPSTSQSLMEWLRTAVNSVKGEICEVPEHYTKNLKLKLLDQTGVAIEQWELNGCVIKSIDFGKLDKNKSEKVKITVTVQPSYCVLLY